MEGYFVGKHKSPYRGSSVEFADYKEYVPGDEVNRIDWRAYGRTRRMFVRQFEAETDMVAYLLVDVSASMNYAGTGRQTKFRLAGQNRGRARLFDDPSRRQSSARPLLADAG